MRTEVRKRGRKCHTKLTKEISPRRKGKREQNGETTEHGFNSYAVFFLLRTDLSQEWWPMTAIPALGRKRQESEEFKASLTYILSLTAAISSENLKTWLS